LPASGKDKKIFIQTKTQARFLLFYYMDSNLLDKLNYIITINNTTLWYSQFAHPKKIITHSMKGGKNE